MPMKAMIYKTLSTVVDDLFACVECDPFGTPVLMRCVPRLQVLHQDADSAQAGVLPRRRRLPGVPVSGMHATMSVKK